MSKPVMIAQTPRKYFKPRELKDLEPVVGDWVRQLSYEGSEKRDTFICLVDMIRFRVLYQAETYLGYANDSDDFAEGRRDLNVERALILAEVALKLEEIQKLLERVA